MKSDTFGFAGAPSAQPSGFFKRSADAKSGNAQGSPFGVTGADGDAAIQCDGNNKDDQKKRKGVQIADAAVAGCLLHLTKAQLANTSRAQYMLTTRESGHREPSVLIVTRPPQHCACRLTVAGAEILPIHLQSTAMGDGACAPVFGIVQAKYKEVCEKLGVPPDSVRPFTSRGKPPSVFDNSLLWDLPCLDPETSMSKFAAQDEDGMLDMLAWAAWTNVLAVLDTVPTQLLRVFSAEHLIPYIHRLRELLEASLIGAMEERVYAIEQWVRHLELLLEECMRLWRGKLVRFMALGILPEDSWSAAGGSDPFYRGAVRLCVAKEDNPVVLYKDLLKAAVWLQDATEFLRDADSGLPMPCTVSESLPVTTLAFAAVAGMYCVQELGLPSEVGAMVADILCGGSRYIQPRDRSSLQQFARSGFAHVAFSKRLGWVAEMS
jgi:hypothetical protein